MKKSIFKLALILIAVGFTLHSCNKNEIKQPLDSSNLYSTQKSNEALLIGNSDGETFYKEDVLLKAFNSASGNNATEVVFGSNNGEQFSLFFRLSDNSGISLILNGDNDLLVLDKANAIGYHSCSGAPCSSCLLESSFLIITGCSCAQADCNSCTCNHTVSTKDFSFTSEDILSAYNSGL